MKPDTHLGTPSPHQQAEGTNEPPVPGCGHGDGETASVEVREDGSTEDHSAAVASSLESKLDALSRLYPWSEQEMREDSPCFIQNTCRKQTRELLKLFDLEDVVICKYQEPVEPFASQPLHLWLEDVSYLHRVFIGTTRGESFDEQDFYLAARFWVFDVGVGNDAKSHGAFFRWLRECFDLQICAILKGKGRYQAWFSIPAIDLSGSIIERSNELGLGCSTFNSPTFTADLPTGGEFELIYLDIPEKGGCNE